MEYTDKITPQLELVGKMNFKSSAVIHASWSPHVPEHSLVLLESGDLYLFDLGFSFEPSISSPTLSRKKLKVVWDDSVISNKGGWLSCDFSYHPQILIVVHSMMVFLVDSSPVNSPLLKHVITPLLKPEGKDTFLAFSIAAAPDHFFFTVATNHNVFLCDIRKPMTPVLRWKHNVAQPSCILVSSLSTLRSHSEDVTYNSASEAGFGILLGSFLNGEFSLFCYGPHVRESVSSSFYAWGLPSDLSLLTDECTCGTCLLKEEFVKDRLPNWVNWQQKKESILGFGILDSNISSQLYDPDMYGGFTLITLTSSGYLEIHRYCASWDYSKTLRKGHYQQPLCLIDSNLCEKGEEGYNYKFKKTFQYLKLDFLWGYLKSDLAQIVSNELVKNSEHEIQEKVIYTREFHEKICQKVNMFGSSRALSVHDVYNDVSSPTSIHEVALRRIWANLPKNLLRFAFANYSDLARELKNVPFEFLEVPCMQPHLPPFLFRDPSSRSSKWSDKQKPTDSLVGPVIPLPLLITFHEDHMQKEEDNVPAAADSEINVECSRVMRVANQVTSQSCEGDPMDDKEDVFDGSKQPFASYKIKNDSVIDDDSNHTKMLFKVGEKDVVNEIFDSNCPVQLRFNKPLKSFGSNELNAYKLLKAQCTNFKQGCSSYQDYLTKSNIK
ncbi:uncharacterized protein [Rutidosis leptorrhynchoides]|uniref:uncharacterized protein n=1 Tax=Rutidosis leptorrhynchoides TaxID=125765 RepID=UPI003A996FD5